MVYARSFGVGDVTRRLPVTLGAPFEIGSITKQFTAASILQLQEAGRLQIDKPLSDYLPDAPHAREVTLRQLLTHTSGLHDYLDDAPRQLVARPITYSDLIARVAALPLDFPPGSRWRYTNTGYLLLGRVIEVVSGETYTAYLQHHILEPLHMKDTYTTADEGRVPNMLVGYHRVHGVVEPAPIIDATWGGAAGLLISTVGDLATWDAALRGGRVVSKDDYRAMTTPFVTSAGENTGYGFGLFVDSAYGQPRIGHTGGSWGFTTADEYFPDQALRIIAFTNLGDATPEPAEALTNVLFADLYPAIASKALTAAPGEDPKVTQTVHAAMRELQTGGTYAHFSLNLRRKLVDGAGSGFVASLGPYGEPATEVFKGVRHDGSAAWYDYVIQFGPGVFLPFSVRIGEDGGVAGFSVG